MTWRDGITLHSGYPTKRRQYLVVNSFARDGSIPYSENSVPRLGFFDSPTKRLGGVESRGSNVHAILVDSSGLNQRPVLNRYMYVSFA